MHRGGPFDKMGEYRKVYFIVDRGQVSQHYFLHGHYMEMGCDTQSTLGMPLFLAKYIVSKWNFKAKEAGRTGIAFVEMADAMKECTRQNELGEEGTLSLF